MTGHPKTVNGLDWISEKVRKAKATRNFGRNEDFSPKVEERVFLQFDHFMVVSPQILFPAAVKTPERMVQDGKESIYISVGQKVIIRNVFRRDPRQHGAEMARFIYEDGHEVIYKYGMNLERVYNRR